MTTYYVSSAGNNSNNGTSTSSPWLTVAKVNAQTFSAGDNIFFNGGDTFTDATLTIPSSGSAGSPITFGSYGTGRATISRSAGNRGITGTNLSYVTVQDLIVVGTVNVSTTIGVYFSYTSGTSNNLILDNLDASSFPSSGIVVDVSLGAVLNGLSISDCVAHGNTSGDGANNAGIIVGGHYGSQPNNVYEVINPIIANCTAYSNTGKAGGSGWSGSGIVIFQCDGGLITNCVAHDNGANNNAGSEPVGIWTFSARNVVIQYCESYNNLGNCDGFDLDGGCINCTIQYCYSHGNAFNGISVFQYNSSSISTHSGAVVRYCISENDGLALGIAVSTGATMTGCVVYGNTCYCDSSHIASTRGIIDGFGDGSLSAIITNNIIYSVGGTKVISFPTGTLTGLQFKGNNYYTTGAFTVNWGGVVYSSYSAWQTATGQEKISGIDVGHTLDPKLVSPGNGGTIGGDGYAPPAPTAYQLLSTSTMSTLGLNLFTQFGIDQGTQDYYGFPLGPASSYPIGAWSGVTGLDILALVQGQQLIDYSPDDILDPATTQAIYISQDSYIPVLPYSLIFIRPDGSQFTVQAPDVALGASNITTPKGTFLSGTYMTYTIAWDKFTFPGVWTVISSISRASCTFMVGSLLEVYLQTESGDNLLTENGTPLLIEYT